MRKYINKIMCFVLVFIMAVSDSSILSFAKNISDELPNTDEIASFDEFDTLEDFSDEVVKESEEIFDGSDDKYETKRLIVISEDADFDICGASSVVAFGNMYVLTFDTKSECKNAFGKLKNNGKIESVDIDMVMYAESNGEGKSGYEYKDTELSAYLSGVKPEDNINVAILDTGISKEMLEFENVTDTGINLSGTGELGSVIDDNGHGTDMASVILGNGNPYINILPIKIADKDGRATVLNTYLGILNAIENEADIINISMNAFQSGTSKIIDDIITDATENGISVVVSAGNDSMDVKNIIPSNSKSAIVVSAIDERNGLSEYSNYGETIDYCSYGDYDGKSGTSYAAASVTGILADLMTKKQGITEMDNLSIAIGGKDEQRFYGNGLLSYKMIYYDDDSEDKGNNLLKNRSVEAGLLLACRNDDAFDVRTDFRKIQYDNDVFDIEYVSSTPEFDISRNGNYMVEYAFIDKETGKECKAISRLIKVVDNERYRVGNLSVSSNISDQYDGVYITVDKNLKAYGTYSTKEDSPSRRISQNSILTRYTARMYLYITEFKVMYNKVHSHDMTWERYIEIGEDIYKMTKTTDESGNKVDINNKFFEDRKIKPIHCLMAYGIERKRKQGELKGLELSAIDEDVIDDCITVIYNMNSKNKTLRVYHFWNARESLDKEQIQEYKEKYFYDLKHDVDYVYDVICDFYSCFERQNQDLMEATGAKCTILSDTFNDKIYQAFKKDGKTDLFEEDGSTKPEYQSKTMNGNGFGYGAVLPDAPDQVYYVEAEKYGKHDAEKGSDTYVGQVKKQLDEYLTKKRVFDEYSNIVHNIRLYDGDEIAFNVYGGACGHVGVYLELMMTDPTKTPKIHAFNEYEAHRANVANKEPGETDNFKYTNFVPISEDGYYTFNVMGAIYSCRFATVNVGTYGSAKIWTNQYDISYYTKEPNGTVKTLSMPNHPKHYTSHSDDITVMNPNKDGWIFDGWDIDYEGYDDNFRPKQETGIKNFVLDCSETKGHINLTARWHQPYYTVHYQLQQPDGSYKTVETKQVTAPFEKEVAVPLNSYDGYKTPKQQTVVTKADNSSVVIYKYPFQTYPVTYIDVIKESNIELGRTTEEEKYGITVSGSNMGSDTAMGAYYPGYQYDSCTTATVTSSGATVYRYFISSMGGCIVHHMLEQPNGTFITQDTDNYSGKLGIFTPDTKTYNGYVSPQPSEVTILEGEIKVVDYEYRLSNYNVTYIDRVKGTNTQLGSTVLQKKFKTTVAGSDLGTDSNFGAYYPGYAYDSCTSATVSTSGTVVYRNFVSTSVNYKVRHLLQDADDPELYTQHGSDVVFSGEMGSEVTPDTLQPPALPDGFVAPARKTVIIKADGTTLVEYKYNRQNVNVTCIDMAEDTNTRLGTHTLSRRYGTTVSGSELGISKEPGAYYPGYVYRASTSQTVGLEDTVVYRYFLPNLGGCTVYHKLEQADGTFVTEDTENHNRKRGEFTPSTNEYDGYATPPRQTVFIRDGETETVEYRYMLKEFDVTYIDKVKDTEQRLGSTVKKKKYTASVAGSDLGASTEHGAYYAGYSYDSCTRATVTLSGATVYRYFVPITATYKVRHLLQDMDNPQTYTKFGEDRVFEGEKGKTVRPDTLHAPELPEGYTEPPRQEATVKADGSTVIEYRYDRKMCNVTYIDMAMDTGLDLAITTRQKRYGETASGSDLGSNTAVGAYYPDYVYDSCTTETVRERTTVYRYFSKNTASYTVKHMVETLTDGESSFVLRDIDIKSGQTGSRVTPGVKTYDGYVSPQPQTVTIRADGTTTVIYEYRIAQSDAEYKVYHKTQNLNGEYSTYRTETGTALAGTSVTPDVLTIPGFRSPFTQTIQVNADGSSSVTYLYTRNRYSVTYIDEVKNTHERLGQPVTESKPFGMEVSGADRGASSEVGRYHANYSYDSCTTATVATSGTTVYRYFVIPDAGRNVADYTVIHQKEQINGTYVTAETETLSGEVNSSVTPRTKTYEGYQSPEPQTVTIRADGSSVVTYQYDIMIPTVDYKVYHQKEQLNGSYLTEDIETLQGKAGMSVTPNTKTYNNYVSPEPQTVTIKADGTTEVIYKYALNKLSVTYVDKARDGETILGRTTQKKAYGSMASGAELGTSTAVGEYYEDYAYDSCTSLTVTANNQIVYRYFTLANANYKVVHRQEQPDGTYKTAETETLKGRIGKAVTPETKEYRGYIAPEPQSAIVMADGRTEVVYNYDIVRHEVAYIDKAKDTDTELGRTTAQKRYGSVASGDERGSDSSVGAYYPGYAYNSCTTATVTGDGIEVYRYFTAKVAQYTVNHQWEQENGSYITVESEQFEAMVGTEVTPETKQYDGYASPEKQTITVKADGTSVVNYKYSIAQDEVPYTVVHKVETQDNEYETRDTEALSAKKGEQVTPATKTYEGYVSPRVQTVTVKADGTTEVVYLYAKKIVSATYIDMVKGTDEELGKTVRPTKFDTMVAGSDIGDSKEPGAYYDGYTYDSCTTARVVIGRNVVYRYFVANDDEIDDTKADYRVIHMQEQPDGTYLTVGTEIFTGTVGESVTPPVKHYEGFISPLPQTVTVEANGTVVTYRYRIDARNAAYTVIHQQEQIDGSYATVETETESGVAGQAVTPVVKEYDGFTSPLPQTVTINADGNTSVTYRYARKIYDVDYIDLASESNEVLGTATKTKKYGEMAAGVELGSSKEVGAYYKDYVFATSTQEIVHSAGVKVYRYFIPKQHKVAYTVIHQKEEIDGTYKVVEEEVLEGIPGETVTPPVKEYDGFMTPLEETIVVEQDGSSKVVYKYERNKYQVVYIDKTYGDEELGRKEDIKPYGLVIKGSELGTSKTPDKYYKGYIYDSCTSALVTTKGATVYRYFVESEIPDIKVPCTIIHQKELPDGTYETVETEVIKAEVGAEITPPVKDYEGFSKPEPETVTVTPDGVTVTYQYKIKDAVCKVVHQQEQPDGTYKTVEEEEITGTVGDVITPEVKDYEGFDSPEEQTVTIMTNGAEVVYKYTIKENDVTYKVIHEKEKPDGTYEVVEVEELEGKPGTEVTPPVDDYDGYISPPEQTVVIKPDGSTEVVYRYEREKTDVSYVDIVPETGEELGREVERKPIGSTVSGDEKGSDRTPDAYYKGYVYDSCTTEVVAKEGTVVYRYFRKHKVTYKVVYKTEQPDGTFKEEEVEVLEGEPYTEVSPPPKVIEGYITPPPFVAYIEPDGSTVIEYLYHVAPEPDTSYKVIIKEEQPDGTYKEVEVEIIPAKPGEEVTVVPEDKDGFETPGKQVVTVSPDGSTTITFEYERKSYDVSYVDIAKDTKEELGKKTEKKKVGATIAGSDLGSDKTASKYYDGYTYDSCTSMVVSASDNVVYRYFVKDAKKENTTYTVIYQEEQPDGTYKEVAKEVIEEEPNKEVTVSPKPKEGFKTPEKVTVKVNPDGTTTVTFKYERESYDVSYIDIVKGTKKELGKATKSRKFGFKVSGSDIGSDRTKGKYYKGYTYDSCTEATVTISGATVYRYFTEDGDKIIINNKKPDNSNQNNNNNGNKDNSGNKQTVINSGSSGDTDKTPITSGDTKVQEEKEKEIIRTGEKSVMGIFIAGLAVAILGCIVMFTKKRKK